MGMFEVDPKGLKKLLAGRDYGFIINELAQNAFDEEGVKELRIEIRLVEGKRQYQVIVADDSPNGFRRLSDAWTLFAESYKKGNPLQRGRFDLGEKLVISLCKRAEIVTTTGAVRFENNKRTTLRRKMDTGTVVTLWVPATLAQGEELKVAVSRLIPPAGVSVVFNGQEVGRREALQVFNATLPTVNVDEEGQLRPSRRQTDVTVYEANGAGAWLYEMGIPVVPIKATWTLDVQQKVPLNMDRDNVSPAFLRKLYAHTLNAMATELPQEDAAADWVVQGTGEKEIEHEAFSTVLDKSMGEKRVIYDPSDPESNMRAVSNGHTLVRGNQLSQGQRDNIRRMRGDGNDPLRPAGRLFPTSKPYSDDPDADPVDVISPHKYTERQKMVVSMAKYLFDQIIGEEVNTRNGKLSVRIVNTTNSFAACFGGGQMDLNVRRLGHSFFDGTDQHALERVLRIFIHEFAHHFSGNHLASGYHDGLTRLGVRLSTRVKRGVYRRYGYSL
jgi:hypothetical protein